MLSDVFAGLFERVEASLLAAGPLARRIPAAAAAWVDYVGERPSLARLLLREVANTAREEPPPLNAHLPPFFELAARAIAESAGDPLLERPELDPVRMASTVAGATLFFVAAMPALLPGRAFDPLAAEALAAHRAEILVITRRLLGIPAPRSRRAELR